jgi:hypothetical protein
MELVLAALLALPLAGEELGNRADYIGGTLPDVTRTLSGRILASDLTYFYFRTNKRVVKIPFDSVNLLEYGQKADRRYLEAILLSPVFLLSKKRAHYLTIGYTDEAGRQQALVFRLDKNAVRPVLAVLEARTGRKVQPQDDEARKGKR